MMWKVTTAIGLCIGAGVLGFWLSERTPPIDIYDVDLLTPIVRPGGDLKVRYYVYRRDNCRTKFQRTYRDSEGVRYALEDVDIWLSPSPLGRDEYVSLIPISPRASQGQAKFRAITVYVCNPVHLVWPIVQTPQEVLFKIEGDPDPNILEVAPRPR